MKRQLPDWCATVPVTPLVQNCSVVCCPDTGRAALVDPGGDIDRLLAAAEARSVAIEKILVTHGHFDHAGAAAELAARLGVPIEGPHRGDIVWIDRLAGYAVRAGMEHSRPFVPNRWLEDGDTVSVGAQTFQVLHCPGHTPGHIVFFHPAERFALVGDVLFRRTIGRTDLPFGDRLMLVRSIVAKLWPLGDDVLFVPGHGPTSTFWAERRSNRDVADHVLQASGPLFLHDRP
jgi:glyoxylase-like metal-dependent hydrolase (beta-lactamase superfamily II)